jgi:hypothetical protein
MIAGMLFRAGRLHTSGKVPLEKTLEMASAYIKVFVFIKTHINKQVFPQAPSPTMTSLRRISAMAAADDYARKRCCDGRRVRERS